MTRDDYLWDRSGEPDVEVQRLEALLRPLRGSRPAPELPEEPRREPPRRRAAWLPVALAASVLVAAVLGWTWTRPARGGWALAWLEGPSWAEARVVRETRLGVGEWIDTRDSRARLAVGTIGEVQLEPATRVRIVDGGRAAHRLSLARGVMHALIWAPPGQFIVDTPSAVAVDLGCRYTLEMGEDGSGTLRVEAGWVGFEHGTVRSLVPAEAVAATRAGHGPGTPHFGDAPAALVAALERVDFDAVPDERARALDTVLALARPRDALSLWHLLARTEGADRARVHDTLAALVPPPSGVTREGVVGGDREMLDAWWGQLGFGSAEFWRDWTAPFAASPAAR